MPTLTHSWEWRSQDPATGPLLSMPLFNKLCWTHTNRSSGVLTDHGTWGLSKHSVLKTPNVSYSSSIYTSKIRVNWVPVITLQRKAGADPQDLSPSSFPSSFSHRHHSQQELCANWEHTWLQRSSWHHWTLQPTLTTPNLWKYPTLWIISRVKDTVHKNFLCIIF